MPKIDTALTQARQRITIATIAVAIFCAAGSSLGLYALAEARLNRHISASTITNLTATDPAVSEYLKSQETYHAHFETIAKMIQQDDRRQITHMLPWLLGITFIASGTAGWFLAKRLLRPIRDTLLSQRRFMQDAAHELRNPLAAMTTMLQHALAKPNDQQNLLFALQRQTTQLTAITTDLLLLEKVATAHHVSSDISQLTHDILEEIHHTAQTKHVSFATKIPRSTLAFIDPQHYVYIARNIIDNAVKFSPPNKKIHISLVRLKNGAVLEVRDNGPGIPPDEVKAVTRRFYRASNAQLTSGTGLGLAIVAKFVNLYGGSLSIESSPPKGTTVRVELHN